MDKLDSALNDYFKHFHRTRDKWTDLLKRSEKSVLVLCNQMEQLQLIKGQVNEIGIDVLYSLFVCIYSAMYVISNFRVEDGTVNLFKIPYLKDNLVGKVCGSIESEVKLVESTVMYVYCVNN